MRKAIIPALFVLALSTAGVAQTVHQKDKWGAKLLYFQENEVHLQDRWGEQILWYDAAHNTIRQKDRWGEKLYYFDFTPSRWQIICTVLANNQ